MSDVLNSVELRRLTTKLLTKSLQKSTVTRKLLMVMNGPPWILSTNLSDARIKDVRGHCYSARFLRMSKPEVVTKLQHAKERWQPLLLCFREILYVLSWTSICMQNVFTFTKWEINFCYVVMRRKSIKNALKSLRFRRKVLPVSSRNSRWPAKSQISWHNNSTANSVTPISIYLKRRLLGKHIRVLVLVADRKRTQSLCTRLIFYELFWTA